MEVSVVAGATLACFVGGLLPWINSEIAVLGASLLLPSAALPGLVAACTVAQMTAKCALYGVTRWAPERLPARARRLISRVDRFRDRRRMLALAVFAGALVGVPPLYLVTLACGVLRVSFPLFAVAGVSGTATRYGLLAWAATALGP